MSVHVGPWTCGPAADLARTWRGPAADLVRTCCGP
eukprot:gene8943-48967_t